MHTAYTWRWSHESLFIKLGGILDLIHSCSMPDLFKEFIILLVSYYSVYIPISFPGNNFCRSMNIYYNMIRKQNDISVQFSHSVVSDCLQLHGLQHARLPCPLPTARACSNSCPLSQWCLPTIASFIIHFSSCLQSFPISGYFPVRQFFASGGQSIGVSASTSVLPMNIQDLFPLVWTGWISLQSKRLSRVFSNTTVQKHQFFCAQLSL